MGQQIDVPGHGIVEFPEGMTDAQIVAAIKANPAPESSSVAGPREGAKVVNGFIDEVKGGLASAPINLYLGAKQMMGGLSPVEQDVLRQNKEAEKSAPVSSFVSNVATLAPAMMVPGANTVAGAALTGAATGAMQPIEGEQSLENIAKGKLLSTALGGAGGAAGQYAGNKLGTALQNRLSSQTANAASLASQNSVKDATLAEAQAAGYTVPRSLYNPTFASNRLESLGGKAAIKQQAAAENQATTNAIARQALGLPEDAPLSKGLLDVMKDKAAAPYREIANLTPTTPKPATSIYNDWGTPTPAVKGFDPKATLESLKQARNDSQGWFEAYNRSKSPEDLVNAKALRDTADKLETSLEDYAKTLGKPELVDSLIAARKKIAQIYDVRRSLNDATGDVSAQTFGRLFEKGKPLSDGLDTIGKFRTAFPQVSQDGAKIPASGVSKSEALAGLLLGGGASLATGNPVGMAAAAIPLLSHPAKALALSKVMQKAPEYTASMGTRAAAAALPPNRAALLFRALSQYGTPALAAQ